MQKTQTLKDKTALSFIVIGHRCKTAKMKILLYGVTNHIRKLLRL